jgi:hypothetical protein
MVCSSRRADVGVFARKVLLDAKGAAMNARHGLGFLAGLGFLLGGLTTSTSAPTREKDDLKDIPLKEDVNKLNLEVNALQTLYHLKATPAQLKELARLVAKAAPKPADRRPAKVSDKYRKTLGDLRQALIDVDDDKVAELYASLTELQDTETPEVDDSLPISDAAREKVAEALRLFSPRQVAGYVADFADEFPVPVDRLTDAFEEARKLKDKEWDEFRDSLADQLAWLVAGTDKKAEARVKKDVALLLDRVQSLPDEDFRKEKEDLEKDARKIAGDVDPTQVVRNWVQRSIAELLSNPELPTVLQARLKKSREQ